MKITKTQLRQIIAEELEALGEGNIAADPRIEDEMRRSQTDPQLATQAKQGEEAPAGMARDVETLTQVLTRAPGVEARIKQINTPAEFKEVIMWFVQTIAKEDLQPAQVVTQMANVLRDLREQE